jgi:hypothetical protein
MLLIVPAQKVAVPSFHKLMDIQYIVCYEKALKMLQMLFEETEKVP